MNKRIRKRCTKFLIFYELIQNPHSFPDYGSRRKTQPSVMEAADRNYYFEL